MQKMLNAKRERIKVLRKDRDVIKNEKAKLYGQAMSVNDQIRAQRKDLKTLYDKRSGMTAEINKRIGDRRVVSAKIDECRHQINVLKSSKRSILDACREKKSKIITIEQEIVKTQTDINTVKGKNLEW